MDFEELIAGWRHGQGKPGARARFKQCPEDFRVGEQLRFAPEGEGDHQYLHIEKTNANTEWLARQLARFAGIRAGEVGYAGRKDRAAVTCQWFSLHLPGGRSPDWQAFELDGVRILEITRHPRKLRIGAVRENQFVIRLRNLTGDPAALEARLQLIAERGFPNYFGEQRFGRDGANLEGAREMLEAGRKVRDRNRRSLFLSAARSCMFNEVLSARIGANTWQQPLPGEPLQLDGSEKWFVDDGMDDNLTARIRDFDLHPTGPLPGRGVTAMADAADFEARVLAPFEGWIRQLEALGLKAERRPLRVRPAELTVTREQPDQLLLRFSLPKGAFATSLLREAVNLES